MTYKNKIPKSAKKADFFICINTNNWYIYKKINHGKKYYWLTGYFNNQDEGKDADENALADGYISVVPVKFDLTAHEYLQELGEVLNG